MEMMGQPEKSRPCLWRQPEHFSPKGHRLVVKDAIKRKNFERFTDLMRTGSAREQDRVSLNQADP
jgi:hypothetical protein